MTTETTETTGGQTARPLPLHRSRRDRVLAGVCGGIAETYGADPTAVRLLAAILGIITGVIPMLIIYLLAAVIVPESTAEDASTGRATRSWIEPGQGALIIGVVLIAGGLIALANELFRIDWDLLWPAALIAFGGIIVLLTMRREHG